MGGRDLKLLINAGLQILIQQGLQFLVLLVKQTSLLDQVLSVHQHLVILGEGLVESAPHRQFHRVKDVGKLLPVELLLDLLIGLLLLLGLTSLSLLPGGATEGSLFGLPLPLLLKLLEGVDHILGLQVEVSWVNLLLFFFASVGVIGILAVTLTSAALIEHLLSVVVVQLRDLLELLALAVEALLLGGFFILVEGFNEELNSLHLVNAERLSDRVDLDGKLLLQRFAFALFECLVVDEEWGLLNEHFENVLNLVVFFFDVSGSCGCYGPVLFVEVAVALALLELAVHKGGVLGMRGTSTFFVGGSVHATSGIGVIQEMEDGVGGTLPWD